MRAGQLSAGKGVFTHIWLLAHSNTLKRYRMVGEIRLGREIKLSLGKRTVKADFEEDRAKNPMDIFIAVAENRLNVERSIAMAKGSRIILKTTCAGGNTYICIDIYIKGGKI